MANSSPSITLVSCNIEGHRHFEQRLLPFLQQAQPDIICLQEVYDSDVPLLEAALNMKCLYQPMMIVDAINVHHDRLGMWGVAILTKWPVVASGNVQYVVKTPQPGIPVFDIRDNNSMNRVLLWANIEIEGTLFPVGTTHFTWTPNGQTTDEQRLSLQALERALDDCLPTGMLCGDFNAPRGQEIFARLATRFTDAIPAHYTSSIDPQLHKAGPLQLMVDGLFTSAEFAASNVELRQGVSDHQAIVATITKRS